MDKRNLLLLAALGLFLVARLVTGLQGLRLLASHILQRLLLAGQLLLQFDKALLHLITAGQTTDLLAEYGLELQQCIVGSSCYCQWKIVPARPGIDSLL